MPIHEYKCRQCEFTFEKIEGDRKSPRWCPECGRRTAHREPPATARPQFNGSGFHATDYEGVK